MCPGNNASQKLTGSQLGTAINTGRMLQCRARYQWPGRLLVKLNEAVLHVVK